MRSVAALAMRSAAMIEAAALIVLCERGRTQQAGREQKQRNSLEHRALEHHFSVIEPGSDYPVAVT
jgi:hypothetical protein